MSQNPTPSFEDDTKAAEAGTRPPRSGFAEIDRAIAEDRLIEYRWKKAWADPWGRRLAVFVVSLFAVFAAFVIYQDVLKT
jgi:hypothetical protein